MLSCFEFFCLYRLMCAHMFFGTDVAVTSAEGCVCVYGRLVSHVALGMPSLCMQEPLNARKFTPMRHKPDIA